MKRSLVWCCALLCASALGSAQTPNYLDDRSTPGSVLQSLYNAINRREYARAYSYWRDSAPPGTPPAYPEFVRGYADTASVHLVTGNVTGEGAAGSVFYTVPVRLEALRTDGSERVFVGCYTLRLVQPAVQEPPFVPLGIVGSRLRLARDAPSPKLPPASLCADNP